MSDIYRVYARGHGGEEKHTLPPSGDVAISMITIGQFGSTMSDQVADFTIFNHQDCVALREKIDENQIIYWTREQRNCYYDGGGLDFSQPAIDVTDYDSIRFNLALDGAADIEGKCGICYWDESKGELVWLIELGDRETIQLSTILLELAKIIEGTDNQIQLYWTACMSAKHWYGTNKKVSFNPNMDPWGKTTGD